MQHKNMKLQLTTFGILMLGAVAAWVWLLPMDSPQPVVGVSRFILSENEQSRLQQAALANDPSAALRLFEYYRMVRLNEHEANRWLDRAAEMGNIRALETLVSAAIQEKKDLGRAQLLMNAATTVAISNGDHVAQEQLRRIQLELRDATSRVKVTSGVGPSSGSTSSTITGQHL